MQKRLQAVIKKLLIWLGLICCVYSVMVVSVISAGHWFNFIFLIIGAVFILAGLFLKKLCRLPRLAKIIICSVLALCLVNFCAVESRIIKAAHSVPEDNAKWVIILGAKVNRGNVSLEYARRIDAAADYARENPGAVLVTTGGKGPDEPVSEGAAAAKRLIADGIPGERIVIESESTSTEENFRFALALMKSEGYETGDAVVIVSSAFHLYRAGLLAKSCGFENVSFLGVTGKVALLPQYYLREYAAVVREYFGGDFR